MDNIELYKEIESRVYRLHPYDYYPLKPDTEIARLNTVLHFMQIGKDSLPILKDKLIEQGNLKQDFLDSL
jgi:hypothetical protein